MIDAELLDYCHKVVQAKVEALGVTYDSHLRKAMDWRFKSIYRRRGWDGLMRYAENLPVGR